MQVRYPWSKESWFPLKMVSGPLQHHGQTFMRILNVLVFNAGGTCRNPSQEHLQPNSCKLRNEVSSAEQYKTTFSLMKLRNWRMNSIQHMLRSGH
jgi:hypothetical protein